MKQLICILLLALCFSSLGKAQAANQAFAADTAKGNENIYFTGEKASTIYQGIVGFTFEASKDAATIYFQGCYNTNDWRNIDTIAASGAPVVDYEFTQSPPKYKSYRMWVDGNVGDTCIITNVRYFLKY